MYMNYVSAETLLTKNGVDLHYIDDDDKLGIKLESNIDDSGNVNITVLCTYNTFRSISVVHIGGVDDGIVEYISTGGYESKLHVSNKMAVTTVGGYEITNIRMDTCNVRYRGNHIMKFEWFKDELSLKVLTDSSNDEAVTMISVAIASMIPNLFAYPTRNKAVSTFINNTKESLRKRRLENGKLGA